MFSFFRKNIKTGALKDDRLVEERRKDYLFQEMVSEANPVNWEEKPENRRRRYPIFNQNGSNSCVAMTLAKLMGILYSLQNKGSFVHFSASDIYQRRRNRPRAGMIAVDALNIARKGVTLENLALSQNMTDREMEAIAVEPYKRSVGDIFKIKNFIKLPVKNIDTVASVIQTTGKGVMVWFYFTRDEWGNVPKVKNELLAPHGSRVTRHSVTAVDYMLYNGKKALVIEDSWGVGYGFKGQRIITEDFFKARNFFAAHIMNFTFAKPLVKKYHFAKTFQRGDRDAQYLQNFLKEQGVFPVNVESTGYYGAITAKAVLKWQTVNWEKFFNLDHQYSEEKLKALGGDYFGKLSVRVANG